MQQVSGNKWQMTVNESRAILNKLHDWKEEWGNDFADEIRQSYFEGGYDELNDTLIVWWSFDDDVLAEILQEKLRGEF